MSILINLLNKYINTYYSPIKIEPTNVKSNTYIDLGKETNDKNPKFKFADNVRISKYKNDFTNGYTPNWSEKAIVIKKFKSTVPST